MAHLAEGGLAHGLVYVMDRGRGAELAWKLL